MTDDYQSLLDEVSRRRTERLLAETRQREAEEKFLTRVAAEHADGMEFRKLANLFLEWREIVQVGHDKRWGEVVPVPGSHIRNRLRNAPRHVPRIHPVTGEPHWSGSWPRVVERDCLPEKGQAVVYVLFDADMTPCYTGSTGRFLLRLRSHQKDGKAFSFWMAYPCEDRAAAYAREEELLAKYKPYLNSNTKNGRGTSGAAPDLTQTHLSDLLAPAVSRG